MAAATLAEFIRNDAEVFRLSVERYHGMIESGLLEEDNTIELLEGVLVRKMSKNPPHVQSLSAARRVFSQQFQEPLWVVRSQDPITLADSEPEPDLVISKGPESRYGTRHPFPEDVLLVVEVADSSLDRDTEWKRRIYAKSGIGLYWVIDLRNAQILTYADPADGDYRVQRAYAKGDAVPLQAGHIAVNDVIAT